MIFSHTNLAGAYCIEPEPNSDERGWFARYYCKEEFYTKIGHSEEWVQMNHSFTKRLGTIRGMHFQVMPFKEIKLIRCVSGEINDVIIDLRKESSTFLQWQSFKLSSQNKKMLYIPEGFAHGFQTLTENVELLYHHSKIYSQKSEGGIRFDDPMINIKWPLSPSVVSQRDLSHPILDKNFKGI